MHIFTLNKGLRGKNNSLSWIFFPPLMIRNHKQLIILFFTRALTGDFETLLPDCSLFPQVTQPHLSLLFILTTFLTGTDKSCNPTPISAWLALKFGKENGKNSQQLSK